MIRFVLGFLLLCCVNSTVALYFNLDGGPFFVWCFISGLLYPRLYTKYLT